jgi:hypothetical protein
MKLSMAFVPAAALLLLSIPATRTTIYSGYAYAALQMGLSTNPEVLIGKKQWLFENTERDLEEYRGTVKVDAEAVVHWKRIYLERMAFARDVGADFVFVITPLKQTANAEFLPTSWRRTGEETRIKQLKTAVRESGLDVLDVTDALIARRRLGEQIWYKSLSTTIVTKRSTPTPTTERCPPRTRR